MSDDKSLSLQLWKCYMEAADQDAFLIFLNHWVKCFECHLNKTSDQIEKLPQGPHLFSLPGDLLQELENLLCRCSSFTKLYPSSDDVKKAQSCVDALSIICRNFDNIPFVSSCNVINCIIIIASSVVEQLSSSTSTTLGVEQDIAVSFLHSVLYFLECLYDPYFIWRAYRLKHLFSSEDKSNYPPAVLDMEVVPFFYDCFFRKNLTLPSVIQKKLLHLFGAIISGAQHNALVAITPATLEVLYKVLSDSQSCSEIKHEAACCIVQAAVMLRKSGSEEQQVDVITITENLMQMILDSSEVVNMKCSQIAKIHILDTLCHILKTEDSSVEKQFLDEGYCLKLVNALPELCLEDTWKSQVICSVIQMLLVFRDKSSESKNHFENDVGTLKLFGAVKNCGDSVWEVIKYLLSFACDSSVNIKSITYPDMVQNVIVWLPDMISADVQANAAAYIAEICENDFHSRVRCCHSGIISTVVEILALQKNLPGKSVGQLLHIIRILAVHSVSSSELKKIFGLLRPDANGKQFAYLVPLLHILSLISKKSHSVNISHFMDFSEQQNGISFGGIQKWPGPSFSFHAWLQLNKEHKFQQSSSNVLFRRQVYCILNNCGCGFEAFFDKDSQLVIVSRAKKKYHAAVLKGCILNDGSWHCIDISYIPGRRPFSFSCVNVYVDHSLQLTAQLKFPPISEPFIYCCIGFPGQLPKFQEHPETSENIMYGALTTLGNSAVGQLSLYIDKDRLRSLTPHVTMPQAFKDALQATPDPSILTCDIGTEDKVWGTPISLYGQLASVSLFCDVLQSPYIRILQSAGANSLKLLRAEDGLENELSSRLILHYDAKAVAESSCVDLSPFHFYPGYFSGFKYSVCNINNVLNTIGGVPVLYPLIENAGKAFKVMCPEFSEYLPSADASPSIVTENNEWVVVGSSAAGPWFLSENQLASSLFLMSDVLRGNPNNQEQLNGKYGIAIVGALLEKAPAHLIDVDVLMAIQQLCKDVEASGNFSLLSSTQETLVFNFKIWSRGNFAVQIGHIQYLTSIIKGDRKSCRRKFGVQLLLDTIRSFYSNCDLLSSEDVRTVRVSLLEVIKFYISRDANIDEVSAIIGFLITCNQEEIISEFLDIFLTVLENPNTKDQLFLLLYEPGCSEILYCLLVNPDFSHTMKIKLLKVISSLLKTEKVYEKSKIRLRLEHVGFSCLTKLLPAHQLSEDMVLLLIEQSLMSDNKTDYHGVLALLNFIRNMNISIKLEAANKFFEVLNSRPNAYIAIVKHIGWQECVLGLLVKNSISNRSKAFPQVSELNLIDLSANLNNQDEGFLNPEPQADSVCLRSTALRRLSQFSSQLSLEDSLPKTPQLLLQLKEHIFDFEIPHLLNRSKSLIHSSSSEDPEAGHAEVKPLSLNSPESKTFSIDVTDKLIKQIENKERALYDIVCHLVYLLLWNGVQGSGKQAWSNRGQAFAVINMLALSNELFASHLEIKQKILEKMLQACLTDLQEAGQVNALMTENAVEIMKITYDFAVLEKDDDELFISERILEGILNLLDVLLVFEDSPSNEGWPEMAYMALDILLICAKSKNLELCAMATARLHSLVQTKPFCSLNQICHLIVEINKIIASTIEINDQEHYSFLIPIVRALLEKLCIPLHIAEYLHTLPSTASGPLFFDEFQQYAISLEWKAFIENFVKPHQVKYVSGFEKQIKDSMNAFWNKCYELSMVAMHKRNREIGESKLRFQSQILECYHARVVAEQARYHAVQSTMHNHNTFVRRRWKMAKLSLLGVRGPWKLQTPLVNHWKLSHHENLSRMRLKLVLNYNFDDHTLASNLRDNQAFTLHSKLGKLPPVALEARVTELQEDSITDEDLQIISASEIEGPSSLGKEKVVINENCELVTLMSVVKGRFEVTVTHMYFFDLSPVKDDVERYDFKCLLVGLREVHLRRYNLRRSALEFFLIDQTNFFLNFSTKVRNKIYSKILTLKPANLFYTQGIRSPAELLKASGLTQKWVQREISNFDYLMQLNTIAGRTYNDLSQYPVFPWIIADYSSAKLDLENPGTFRDLSKPMGIVNSKNIPEVKSKYESFVDITGTVEKFHYGTHYSNSAGVVHYLVRMEPFTSLHIDLQSGRFDVADRQFHSFEATWKMMMDNPNDVKELIPEFFYLPEFLLNLNDYDLGKRQGTKERVDNVKLPTWATSAEDFVYKHRKALECEYVSQHLHEWIDLIFGYKQKGPAAVEALNVFYYVSYEGAVDLDAIEDPVIRNATEGMINNFGQTPCQLLKEPHPKRKSLVEVTEKLFKTDKPPNLFLFIRNFKAFFVEASYSNSSILFINVPKLPVRSFIQHGMLETLVTIDKDGVVGVHGWLPYDKSRTIPNYFTFERDVSLSSNKSVKRIIGPFHPGLEVSSKLFVITNDAKFLVSGGHWDNSIQIHSLAKCKLHAHVIHHQDIVTCLALDHTSCNLMSGSRDTTCMIWDLSLQGNLVPLICESPKQILFGHDDEVSCVSISTDLDMAISGSVDGTVNIHTVREGHFMRTLYPINNAFGKGSVTQISLSQMGYLCFHWKLHSNEESCCLYLHTINGKFLTQRNISSAIMCMCIAGDFLVTGSHDGTLTVYETFGLHVATSLSLHIPILSVNITPGNTHILASLQDGKLIVIGISSSTLC